MNSWTPLWSQIVDSSLWEEPPEVRVLFVTMLALKDADHVCRVDAYKLHRRANLSEEQTVNALRVLERPDKRRTVIKQEFEGRRIEKVADGWLILNGDKYRSMIRDLKRREYKANWQRDKRAAGRSRPMSGEVAAVQGQANGHLDENFEPVKPRPVSSPVQELPVDESVKKLPETPSDSGIRFTRAYDEGKAGQ